MAGFGSVNIQILVGRLGQNPDVHYTPGGHVVARLSIATENRFKKNDQWHSQTVWHRVVVWNKAAEFVKEYFKKGDRVFVKGRTEHREWEDKDGAKRYITEVIADDVQAVEYKGNNRSEGPVPPGDAAVPDPEPDEASAPDDVPF